MSLQVDQVIVQVSGEETSRERWTKMLHAMEKQFKTGPIIGESKELLIYLISNLEVRDLILSGFGISDEEKAGIFEHAMVEMKKQDEEIKAKREKK